MIFKYCSVKSIGCFKKSNFCCVIKLSSYFEKGEGLIFYKQFIDFKIIKTIKFIFYYFNIDFSNYNIFINIIPKNYFKLDNCLDLSLFFLIFLSFFKINFKENIFIFGILDFKNGRLLSIDKIFYKTRKIFKNFSSFIIIPKSNKVFFKNNFFILNFEYIYEVFLFLKRCLAQRESAAITRRLSRVQFS